MSQPLVAGGVIGSQRFDHGDEGAPSYISHTLPEIYDNTIIVAATHPNVFHGHPNRDGWFLSDFYAFNYLLKGACGDQVWLTAADPNKLLQAIPDTPHYFHGNPYQDRRVVLSEDMLKNKDHTPVTVVSSSQMIDRFLDEVRVATAKGKKENAPVLLFVFCHGLPDFQFLLRCGERNRGLTPTRLKEAIEPGSRVTLVSSACYSGGWALRPLSPEEPGADINATMILAAHPSLESTAWQESRSIGRTCGSVFASSLIEGLTAATSPLLDSRFRDSSNTESLQPETPDKPQTETYNAFCRSILDVCRDQMTRLWSYQQFTFRAQDDQWGYSWTGRTGIPVARFEQRWKALKSVPYEGPAEDKLMMDPHPSNPTFQGSAGPSKTGGASVVDEMTRSICQHRVETMARLFLQTCPDDWDKGWGPLTRGIIEQAMNGNASHDVLCEVSAIIRFRWEYALLTDAMVQQFRLPLPDNKICVLWHSNSWVASAARDVGQRRALAFKYITFKGFLPTPAEDQGPPFTRPHHYLAAAVAEAGLKESEIRALIDKLAEFMHDVKKFHHDRVTTDTKVQERGRKWYKTVGRRIRRSLSRSPERDSSASSSEPKPIVLPSRNRTDSTASKLGSIPELRPSTPGAIQGEPSRRSTDSGR
ncbi:hypothetical protein G7046_g2789 [Stylonectria norvegica]|nr:hypothetical protein G7046_g2789 [Stylonectria norvegica]